MYAIKGGWAGQTFALAKCNESEARKSRIRRSKEERKAMVESFIKKYQKSNNGNFPSMNLTHKEVGGSFYTVREIVREVIQENRVLGPAKLSPEEQQLLNTDQFLEQYPLGSISYEPQIPLPSSPDGTDVVSDHQSTDGEMVAANNELSNENEDQGVTNGQIINGSQIDIEREKANDLRCIENQVSEPSEPTWNFEGETVASKTKVNLLVSEPLNAKEGLEDKMDASKANLTLQISEPLDTKESLEEEMDASKAKPTLLVSAPLDTKESLEEEMDASKAKPTLLVSEPLDTKESLEEDMDAYKAKLTLLVTAPSDTKENLKEEMDAPKAELGLLVNETSDAKESLKEKMVESEAKASLLVSEPSDAKESLREEMVVPEAKVNLVVNESLEAKENLEKELAAFKAKVDPLAADVIVETFPIRPLAKSTDSLSARSGKVRDAKSNLEKTEVEMELRTREGSSMNSIDNSKLVGKDHAKKKEDTLLENSNGFTTKDAMHQHGKIAEVETIKAPNGAPTKYPNVYSESMPKDTNTVSNDKAEAQPRGSTKKEGTPTLDRINLKSWEEPSRTQEKNPFVSIFQSFIAAFVKLWSE